MANRSKGNAGQTMGGGGARDEEVCEGNQARSSTSEGDAKGKQTCGRRGGRGQKQDRRRGTISIDSEWIWTEASQLRSAFRSFESVWGGARLIIHHRPRVSRGFGSSPVCWISIHVIHDSSILFLLRHPWEPWRRRRMADGSSKMDGGGDGSSSAKMMVDDSPIMRGGEAAKASDMANYFISYAVRACACVCCV